MQQGIEWWGIFQHLNKAEKACAILGDGGMNGIKVKEESRDEIERLWRNAVWRMWDEREKKLKMAATATAGEEEDDERGEEERRI